MSSSDKPKPFGVLPMMLILFATLLVMTVGLNILGHRGSDMIDQVPTRAANTLLNLARKAHTAGLGCRPDDATPPASGTATRQVLLLTGGTGVKVGEAPSLARTVSVRCDTTPGREGVSLRYYRIGENEMHEVNVGTPITETDLDRAAAKTVTRMIEAMRPFGAQVRGCAIGVDGRIDILDASGATLKAVFPNLVPAEVRCRGGGDQSWLAIGYLDRGSLQYAGDLN